MNFCLLLYKILLKVSLVFLVTIHYMYIHIILIVINCNLNIVIVLNHYLIKYIVNILDEIIIL